MAAKTTKWIGSTDSDWDVAGNWSNGIPISGDTMLVDSSAGRDLIVNVDRTGDEHTPGGDLGLNLALLHLHHTRTVNVGSIGAPLMCLADKIKVDGLGDFYFESKKQTAVDLTDLVVVRGQGYTSIVSPSSGGTVINRLEIVGASIVDVRLDGGGSNYLYAVRDAMLSPLVNVTGSRVVSEVHCVGAEVDWNVSLDAARVFLDDGQFTLSGNSIAVLYQDGGLFLLNSNDSPYAIDSAFIKRGVFDSTQTAGQKFVNGLEYVLGSANVVEDPDLHTIVTSIIGD